MSENLVLDTADVIALAAQIVDEPSTSGSETHLADRVEATLAQAAHLQLHRDGDTIVAATNLGRDRRIIVAGHLDTVPPAGNLPSQLREIDGRPHLWGRGSVDMKSAVATHLYLALALSEPRFDITWVFYDHEEVEAHLNGLGRTITNHPEWISGDLAIVGEPTAGQIEAGCNGTIRVVVTTHGRVAHSARAWLGDNAIHRAGEVLDRLRRYQPGRHEIDGLEYRESLNAVWITGGVATNSIPDRCDIKVNYRFAPTMTTSAAIAHVKEVCAGIEGVTFTVEDESPGALPGVGSALGQELIAATGASVSAKQGWTDVARFSALGIPALNYGPGEPTACHTDGEACPVDQIISCTRGLGTFLDPHFTYPA